MKKNVSPYERALYIVLVPVVLLIIFLNSGVLQRALPAASVNGQSYTVAAYDFYYFDYYNSFLEENEDKLDELGYDPDQSAGRQDYDGSMTWRDYFLQKGEEELAETAYFYDLSQKAGYQFSDTELLPIQKQLEKNQQAMDQYGLKEKNFYVSYYGRGMTKAIYEKQLERKVKAQAYKQYLVDHYQLTDEEWQGWQSSHQEEDYKAVNLKVITLEAGTDRETGKVGERQVEALTEKLTSLQQRYEDGESFASLQQAFSTDALGDESGDIENATRESLPEVLSSWCIDGQENCKAGDYYSVVEEDTGTAYFAVLTSFGGSGLKKQASMEIGKEKVEEALKEALEGDYAVNRNKAGMTLAAN